MSAELSIDTLAAMVQTEAIAALESIYLDGPKNPYSGVCSNMWNALDEAFPGDVYNTVCDLYATAMGEVIADWPLFSGEPGYPIPGGSLAYCAHDKTHTLWEGKQREYRMALIEYLQANLDCVGRRAMSKYADVVQALEDLLECGPVQSDMGVCGNVVELLIEARCSSSEWYELVVANEYDMYNTWAYYSGSRVYPIPGGEAMYATCSAYFTLWDGEQGALRYDFIRHCIAFIEQQYPA